MKTLKLISAAILLATMQAAGAAQYYVCDTGSDSNDGLSPDTPIATASKAISIFNAISAGDSVLFCRGGKFTVANDLRIYNPNCQASNPCTLADYQPPSGQLPNLPVLTQTGGLTCLGLKIAETLTMMKVMS
ncbi:hypothetical protein [Methylocucumis oryzae]|uniref:Pectate lyase superfamily protein domain-containing protein n=1 Tax=Methylocucumis oryzae TaxID=1632867 RepID=A0A0F3IG38_9GAMM|nr:hypothetical protein [Methylocucumis oryzae]KJV05518.1 hypothetical protein VZ94_17655 [Methylocucumis oryzae]